MRKQSPLWLKEAIAFILILTFVYAAASKLMDHERFQEVIGLSPLVGRGATVFSWLVPISEILISGFLMLPATRRLGFWFSFMLMLAFTLYVAYMVLFVPNKPCGCGGVLSNLNWTDHMLFNISLTALAFLGTRLAKGDELFVATNRSRRIPV